MGKFSRRLQLAMDARNMRPTDLCKLTGLSDSTIANYRSGYAVPRKDRVEKISEVLNVDPAWLLGYDSPLQPEDEDFLNALHELSAQDQLRVLDYMKFVKSQEAKDVQG